MKILIEDKFLKIIDKENLRTGNVNSYKMSIEYDSFYNDRVLMIYFKQDDIKKIVTVGPDNIIDIPHEVLENVRDIYIGFYSPSPDGDKLKDRYCSNFDRLTVIEGAYDEDATPTEELTPTILEKYLQEMKDFYNESLKEYNDNADLKLSEYNNNSIQKVREYNENAHLKKEEIDKVADEVAQNKTEIEEIEKRVKESEQNAKTSETNAKSSAENAQKSETNAKQSETNAQNSANKAIESENNIIEIEKNIKAIQKDVQANKEATDTNVATTNANVTEATNQAKIAKEQADISITNAGKTSTDRTAIGNMKNDVSSMKSSVEQTKTDIQGIYNDTVYAKDETLQAKEVVENSLEKERIESEKRYAKSINTDTIVVEEFAQVELDEDGYMEDVSIEASKEITQETHDSTANILYTQEKYWEIGGINQAGALQENKLRLRSKELMPIEELINYYCSIEDSKYCFVNIHYYDSDKIWLVNQESITNNINNNQAQSFTTPEGAKYFKLLFKKVDESEMTLSDLSIAKPMVVKGTSKIDFLEGYPVMPSLNYPSEFQNMVKEVSIQNNDYTSTLSLSEGQFLGNFKGYSNAIDKGVLKGQLKELVLTGDESWRLFQTSTNTARFVLGKAPHIMVNSETETMYLCNYFKAYLPSERIEDKEGLFVSNSWYNEINQNEIYIRTNINEISTLDSFKAKLKELYDSGTPVKILYVALKEEQQELSQENLQVVNSLQTYHGENNISTPEAKLTFKANQGIPSYVDKVVNEKLVENNLSERKISDNKYARPLKTQVTDVESTRIYAENDVVDDLIINGVELTQVVTENSPSLDNPSEIQIASEQNIQICKNNYLNTTQIANENFSNGGLTVATDENGIFTVNGTHSEQVNINFTNLNFNIKENQVIKLIPLGGNVNYQGNILNCINSILWNKEWKTLTLLNLNSSLITSSDTVKYFQVRFIIPVQQSSITYTNFKFGIMVINADDNIQDYHPYYGTNITIPLVNSAIGQYADTIDRENKVHNKVIQELTLTGDENWNAAGSNDVTNVFSINLNYSVENYTGLCNFLKTGVSGNVEKFTPLGTSLYIAVNKTRASTVEEFKALLAQLYSSGNPLKVYLVRVSPTKNPLSEEVQTALSNLKLYQDLNNIAIDNGSMSFIYNKSLLRSLEEKDEKIDGLQSQIDEIKSLLSSTSTASLLAENLAKDNESEVI